MPEIESNVFWLKMKGILHNCPDCGNPVPIAEISESLECPACGSTFSPDDDLWKRAFGSLLDASWLVKCSTSDDPSKRAVRREFKSTKFGLEIDGSCTGPVCTSCQAAVEPPADVPDTQGFAVRCTSCGNEDHYEPASAWLRQKGPTVTHVGTAAAPAQAKPSAPVVMTCPNCDASLSVTSENKRLTQCEYCGSSVRLPDDVWKVVHPAKKASDLVVRAVLGAREFSGIGKTGLIISLLALGWAAISIPFVLGMVRMLHADLNTGATIGGVVMGFVGFLIFALPGVIFAFKGIGEVFRARRLASRFP